MGSENLLGGFVVVGNVLLSFRGLGKVLDTFVRGVWGRVFLAVSADV